MRRFLLEASAGIVALLFLTSIAALATHHAKRRFEGVRRAVPPKEYLWAVVPWVMVAAAAFPAVWPILGPERNAVNEVPDADQATTAPKANVFSQ